MLRRSSLLQRTSRRGPGGWTNPVLTVQSPSGPKPLRPGEPLGSGASPSSPSPPSSSSASHNLRQQQQQQQPRDYRSISDPRSPHYNWRADHALYNRGAAAMSAAFSGQNVSALVGGGRGAARGQSAQRVNHSEAERNRKVTEGEDVDGKRTWLGGDRPSRAREGEFDTTTDPFAPKGATSTFSMVKPDTLTLTHFLRMMMDATVKPRAPDNQAFGGDGATERSESKETLKAMDSRVVPFAHEELMNDYLKNIVALQSPSGHECARSVLRGRIVGLLFFSDTEPSMEFMRTLRHFTRRHTPDFLCVAISMAGTEMRDLTRGFGFFHCTHRDGATWVARDAGVMTSFFTPMPQLVIVDGTTGLEITRRGRLAVTLRPDTCFDEWRQGDGGYRTSDYLRFFFR